jgi:hypothetical protein
MLQAWPLTSGNLCHHPLAQRTVPHWQGMLGGGSGGSLDSLLSLGPLLNPPTFTWDFLLELPPAELETNQS